MKKILLVCNAGMSTSMLVKKMQSSAEERSIEAHIEWTESFRSSFGISGGIICLKIWN